ncbi:MAG: carboxypeptidase regulatory-like domain-containing protein, partial [Bryobacteraceae bacterium]|nr:carboxypeptidase regulatory-like domain-containing protein [Bryobacteraceae bacterium]
MHRIIQFSFLALLAPVLSWCQESRGSITGTVTDQQGAVIPGAAIVVTNTETNLVSRTVTNATGYFEVNLLNPGAYSMTVEATGFKRAVRSGLQLNVAGRLEVNLQLQVG